MNRYYEHKKEVQRVLEQLGIQDINLGSCGKKWYSSKNGEELISYDPTTGEILAKVQMSSEEEYEQVIKDAYETFLEWRMLPAPKRGEIIRQLGVALREKKALLGALVSIEMGKIRAEGEGEVQEMIDMADFAVGLSRQLYGLTMQSERPMHRMYEHWHPLGVVGVITAFNFPVAVWSWNAMIAAVCGDTIVWKPSSETPLCSIAVQHICNEVLEKNGWKGVFNLVIGKGSTIGERLIHDQRVPLISATGSVEMGRRVAEVVGKRLGKVILELGGNNGIIVMDDADLDLALRAVVFGAVGTAGQRCTTTRRLFLHRKIADKFVEQLINAYKQVTIGDPLDPNILMGPLVNMRAVEDMMSAIELIKQQGGEIIYGGERVSIRDFPNGSFVLPTLVKATHDMPIIQQETFAPILYIIEFEDVEEAIRMHNSVPQGLSSAMFTNSIRNAELFLSAKGSDCGIANINIGTSGAEIGGAFGGEKDTGGGREAGSDAWKAYMRRQTTTINWSSEMPLAQGIKFGKFS